MFYYPEDKVIYLQFNDMKVYLEPDRLDIISSTGKKSYEICTVQFEEFYEFESEERSLSANLRLYKDVIISLVPRVQPKTNEDFDPFVSSNGTMYLNMYPNNYNLIKQVTKTWFKNIVTINTNKYNNIVWLADKTILNHALIIQHLYELRNY